MKIIIITRDNAYKRYFINKINSKFVVDALFYMPKGKIKPNLFIQVLRNYWRRGGKSIRGAFSQFISSKKRVKALKTLYPKESKKEDILKNILKDNYRELDYNGPIYKYYDVNSSDFHKKIVSIKPDLMIVFGTSILADSIINMAKVAAINVHYGLSPYYRGDKTTIWPIYNDEPEYIGVTIHHLSSKIDGGAIITQERPLLDKNETLFSIELKLAKLATELVIKTIEYIELHNEVPGVKQDFSKGKLYLSKEITEDFFKDVKTKFEGDYFKKRIPIDEKRYNSVKLIQNV